MGVSAENVFGTLAGALSKLGFFMILPVAIVVMWYATQHQFETDNAKHKMMSFAKLAWLLFFGLQLPTLLLKVLSR